MPDYVGGNIIGDRAASFKRRKRVKIGLVDAAGFAAYTTFDTNGPDATRAEVDGLRAALGDASNAGVFYDGLEDNHSTARTDARAINDAFGQVSTKIVFIFTREDNDQLREKVELPAPKRELLVFGGSKPLPKDRADEPMIDAIITNSEAAMNSGVPDGEPEYRFAYAYFSDRKQSGGAGPQPNVVDPVV